MFGGILQLSAGFSFASLTPSLSSLFFALAHSFLPSRALFFFLKRLLHRVVNLLRFEIYLTPPTFSENAKLKCSVKKNFNAFQKLQIEKKIYLKSFYNDHFPVFYLSLS